MWRTQGRAARAVLEADSPETNLCILVVSYYFPPDAAVGGKRIARFCQHLPEFGIRPIVLTVDQGSCGPYDHSIQLAAQPLIERARPDATFLDRYYRWTQARRVAPEPKNNGTATQAANGKRFLSLRDHLLALLQFPDSQKGWYRPAVTEAHRIIRDLHIDGVLSSGPPWTTHAIAYSISHRFKIPWIADFRDPWTSNPWIKYSYHRKVIPAWRERLDQWVEGRWTRYAKMVTCTTSRHRDYLLATHSDLDENRVLVIPNGFESNVPDGVRPVRSQLREFLHAGNLYGDRRIDVFCRAVQFLVRKGRFSPDRARVVLMGDMEEHIERSALDSTPELFANGMIEFRPRVEWKRAQEAIRQADVLLIFQGHHPTAIPAKFYEYMLSGKPIVAIADRGALRDIVLETGSGFVANPDDETEIASVLELALQAEPRQPDEIRRLASQFDFRNLTAKLAKGIREVLKTPELCP